LALTVAVQAEQRLVREGIAMVLADEPDIDVVGTASDGNGITELCETARPDVVVLELTATSWDLGRLVGSLRRRQRSLTVVGIAPDARSFDESARRAGVNATISDNASVAELTRAVRARSANPPLRRLSDRPRSRAADCARDADLTPRQRQVLEMIGAGCTAGEIATELGISPKTVENHKQQVFRRLGVHNQSHAVAIAIRRGLVRSSAILQHGDAS
jgi:DNA-binding NarL/FixJ family response regulator